MRYTYDMFRIPTIPYFNKAEPYSVSRPSSVQYYNSSLSFWLSVDPLADKYPNLSPYTYCADNPVRLVDPDGMNIWHPDENGNLVADKGDNAWTLARYLNTSPEISKKMLAQQGYTINNNGKIKLKVGDIFEVDYGNITTNNNDLGMLGNTIRNYATPGIAQDLFSNFWSNEGDVELTGKQFAGILLYIKSNGESVVNKGNIKLIGNSGKSYEGLYKEVNFYGDNPYSLAFGKATIYTTSSGTIVGFYDKYDFNSQPWGIRTLSNEIKTRLVNCAARLNNVNSSIRINYGYSKRD